ncbi:phosphoglycolate phosphatase [Halomonas mongoliensis]|uniref:phosphoglycolate phosphatase n=1 Tax=Halomonas mongoliensis TaxID=321265 RepID=UPI00403A8634
MSEQAPAGEAPLWHLYLLETAAGTLYTGITTDVARRLAEHAAGRGAKALRGRGPLTLRHQEPVGSRGEALRLEAEIKRLSATRKRSWLAARQASLPQTPAGVAAPPQGESMHPILDGIDLVAFDLDGTLIDSVPDLAAAVDATLSELGLPEAGEKKVSLWVGNGALKLVERALADALGETPSSERLALGHQRFLYHYGRDVGSRTRLYPGVVEALDALRERGLPLALVTNKPFAFIAPLLEGLGLAEHFALCLGGDSLPEKKPHPAPLLHLASHFDLAPSRCLMVGDSRHDIAAGKAAGFRTLAVPYGYNHGEPVQASGPDGMVESLAELV